MSNRAHVVLKLAVSLDGRIATRTGASRWITSPEARARVHALRAMHPGIGVGIGTALADDPELTVRDASGPDPIRVVFDSKLRLPLESKLVASARKTRTIVVTVDGAASERARALEARGVDVVRVSQTSDGQVDLGAALAALARASIASILVEGGAALAGALLAGRYVDELHVFIAPILLGPEGRPSAVAWSGPSQPSDAPRIVDPIVETCGPDVYVRGPVAFTSR